MPRRSSLLCAAALSLSLSALVAPAGASAVEDPVSRVVLHDPTGDVWAIGDGENEEGVSAADVPGADVVRAVVRHGRRNVVVKMTFTDLRRVEPQSYSATIMSRRQYGAVFVSARPGRWKGRHQLVNSNFSNVKCPKLSHSINYDTEQITVSVPRNCIGRPKWVKVGMANFMFRGETEDDFQEITDNPHSTSAEGSLTRRLYRAGS
jgi:hypothetical protein